MRGLGSLNKEPDMNMKQSGMRNLLQKLSNLGLETFGSIVGRSSNGFINTISELCTTLLDLKGEAASVAVAEEILAEYRDADDEEKTEFFRFLYDRLGPDHARIEAAIAHYQQEKGQAAVQQLAQACEAPRQELFRTLNTAPGGTMALIEMREDLHRIMSGDEAFPILDRSMLRLFQAWFNRGFLELRRFDWQTPAMILEKLIQYESVHEIKGWPDLRRRLEQDRGCFGFFHPAIPNVPLIFVEAALTRGISTNIHELLQQEAPDEEREDHNTAVFYSINNCLNGLRGVSFGNFLIKQVIERLSAEEPSITQYATLSPVPGFMRWLKEKADLEQLVSEEEREHVMPLQDMQPGPEALTQDSELKQILTRLCAHYLVREKSRGNPVDPVARFHLGNGARLEQINWLADTSENGLKSSMGIMVNYVYDRKQLARNHEAYVQRQEVAHSSAIKKLLQ